MSSYRDSYRDSLPPGQRDAYDRAIKGAGECFAEAYAKLLDPANSDADCAQAAYRSTGPSLDVLEQRIAAWRDEHGVIRRDQAREEA